MIGRGWRKAFCAGIAAIIVVGIGAVLHQRMIGSQQAELRYLQSELVRIRVANDVAAQSCASLEALRQSLRQFARQVPPEVDLGTMLPALQTQTTGEGIVGREILTRPAIPGSHLSRTPVLLRLQCSFDQLVSLLESLERSPRCLRIDRLIADRPAADRGKPLQVEVDFSVFSSTSAEISE